MSLSIRTMRYFVTALARGSISGAAGELNVASSAVAAAIGQIEDQFQLKLVNRHRSRGITATSSGRLMARKCAKLLEEYDGLLADGLELKQALTGELRIGYYAPVAPAFLPQILTDLAVANQITFHLEECDNDRAQDGLLAGDFDAILFVSDAVRPQIAFDVLIEAPAYCLVAADHPFASASSVFLHQLAGEPVLVLNRPVASDYYRGLFQDAGRAPEIVAYANSTEMIRGMVGAGHGCALLNMVPLNEFSYAGDRLAAVPIADPLPPLTLSVGYDKSNPRRIVSRLVRLCEAYFRAGPGRHRMIVSQTASTPGDQLD